MHLHKHLTNTAFLKAHSFPREQQKKKGVPSQCCYTPVTVTRVKEQVQGRRNNTA